jgi:uncharacterized protein YbjT (DUF2867 family)
MAHYRNVIRAACDSGVARSVALSGLDADPSSPFCYAVSYGHTWQPLAEGGLRWQPAVRLRHGRAARRGRGASSP